MTTFLTFLGKIQHESVQTLLGACADLCNEGVRDVCLLLSSPGGSVDKTIAAYNVLRGMPFELTTHNIGRVESMANVLFLAGQRRYAAPSSTFLFHGVGFQVGARTRFDLESLRDRSNSVERDQRKIAAILADRTELQADEIDELFSQTVTKDADYAVAKGIAHEVRTLEVPSGARMRQLHVKD